jgi:hypothetical protein
MNRTNSNTETYKDQQLAQDAVDLAGTTASRLSVTKLVALDGYMAASSYGPDHPWRLAIAEMLATEVEAKRQTDPAKGVDPLRRQAHEIESRLGNIAILLEAIFDKLDAMNCDTPEHRRLNQVIHTFANSAMESAQAIRTANQQILSLTGGVQ